MCVQVSDADVVEVIAHVTGDPTDFVLGPDDFLRLMLGGALLEAPDDDFRRVVALVVRYIIAVQSGRRPHPDQTMSDQEWQRSQAEKASQEAEALEGATAVAAAQRAAAAGEGEGEGEGDQHETLTEVPGAKAP